jgi:GT2 family glycosyltransferase
MLNRIYRWLPLSPFQKRVLKNIVFIFFGCFFKRNSAYISWLKYSNNNNLWKFLLKNPTPNLSFQMQASAKNELLKNANGMWEWADYELVKSKIYQLRTRQISEVKHYPLPIIDIKSESLDSVAARVVIPHFSDEREVSIIIPVYNNLKLTLECLLSVSNYLSSGLSIEIIIADDASTDETFRVVSKIPNLSVIRNSQNIGFLRNCNKALNYAKGKYVVFLNNDVQVTHNWLINLHKTFTNYPKVGIVGPKFVYPSGHLQEAGAALKYDGTADMVGLNEDASLPRYNYVRRVDYISGACLMMPTLLAKQMGGFSEDFLPCYCEDSDLCLRVQDAGYSIYYNPASTVIHHLSSTTSCIDSDFKSKSITANLVKLQNKWLSHLNDISMPKIIAFYLPQYHPFPENNFWWGEGFTEWTNVSKAQPNFVGHYQPRLPADLGFYDLRIADNMEKQAALARRYGIHGFCFYYYWFNGKRLMEQPIDQMLDSGKPDIPFCICWANENWSRRWDGLDQEILIAQTHSAEDDEAVITDMIRYLRDPRYIRIDNRPMILVYRVTLFPDFAATAARWRKVCKEKGVGEIYISMVESIDLVHAERHPSEFGCDAAIEFPPLEMADSKSPSGKIINPNFEGGTADYREFAIKYATRSFPGYKRFKGVMPGWDNTARRQNNSFCFEHATPGAFQAWLEDSLEQSRKQHHGDERLVFVNAWNEWAEGAYLEPDRRFGHTYLEAVKNATESARLLRRNKY